ncbi:sensor histidine kinase [Brachybacterium sp. AOP43-C2-M15]|uniref:sensor histidine kinase n=1 Tax=Brachybacterium sp. AOP43-C2-M15 TaxID=3457661 RepID=UPI004034DC06
MTDRTATAPLIRRLLPPLQVLSLLCLLFAAIAVALTPGPWAGVKLAVAVIFAAAVPVVAAAWIVRAGRRSGRARAALSGAVGLVVIPVAVSGTVGFTSPVLLLAVALVVIDIGRAPGWGAATVITAVGALLHLMSGHGALVALSNALPVAVLLAFGIALGSALRAYEEAHADDVRTIAERDRALARLETAMVRLRRTTEVEKELLLADERARSARDLHDGLGHRLTLVSMGLEFAQRARRTDADAAWEEIAAAEATAREALAEMRTWVRALSPVRDAEATGAAAIEAIAESFRGTGLEVDVEADDHAAELSADASLLLYRAVQEGLTNALRHGRAERVRITLVREGAEVVLELCSDLDTASRAATPAGEAARGFGLRGVAERARALDGHIRAGRRGDRFALEVRLPAAAALEPDPSAPGHGPRPPSHAAGRP